MSHYSTTPKRGACSPRDPTAFTRDISSTYRKTQEHGSNSNPCTTGRTVHPHHTAGSFKEERDFAPSVGHTTDVRHTAAKCENYLHDTTNPPWLGRSAVTRQQHSNRVATPLTGATSTGYPTERNSARCGLNHVTRRTGRASELISDSPKPEAPCSSVFPKCTRAEYATHPSLEALQYYSENRLAVVEDFTVIREGYGEIKWPGLTDIRGLSIDDDVLIEDRAVEVYPSNGEKACIPVGRGLNKPALVTLYNCKPKTSGEGLSAEQEAELHRQHVEKVRWFTEKMGAQFIALTPEWVWKFRVEHFSRYAFEDQDSDESLPSARNTALSTTKSNNTTLLCSLPTDSIGIIKPKDIDYDALVDIFFERYTEMKSSKASFTATKHLEASLVSRCHFDIHQRREEGHEVLGKPYNHFHSIYLKYINELLEITFRLFQHEENAERLLLLQLECTVNFITSTQDVVVHPKMRQFLKYLEDTWRLAYILFGTIDDTEDETHSPQATQDKYRSAERIPWGEQKPTLPPLNDAQDETHVAETFLHGRELCKLRLHLVSEWFAQVNRQTVLTHLEALEGVKKEGINQKTLLPFEAENRLEKVFYRLMGNQIKEAVNDLIPPKASSSVCFFRLALCLVGSASPSLFSVPSNRQHLFQLLLEWQKYNIYDRIPLPILRIHHILAGCIDRLVASKTPDWRTLFALLLWYPSLDASLYIKTKTSAVSIDPHDMFGDNVYGTQQKIQTSHSLHRALYVYSEQLLKIPHQTSTPAPLPQYMGVVRRDILTNDPLDLHFSLLKLFCNGIFDFPKIFHPVCVGHQPHSIILLWPLFQAFKCILKVDCNQQHSTLTQFELYLDELFFQYLQSVGLWKWCILLLINQVSQTRVPELNAICRLTDVLMKCTPSPLLRSNVAQYLFYTEYVNFLVSAPIGLPPFLISYVQAIRYRSDHLHVQAADLWLECAVSSLENKDEDNTPLSQKQCAPSAFKKAFPHGLPFSACPSPTSFFYNSILDLLMSRDFMIKIQKLCSLLEGHAHFLWDALRLNGVGEFATHKSTIKIFKHLLHDVELLFVQNVPQQRLHHHYYKLLTRSFLELSRDITRKSHLFLFPKEWEKCVIMPLCQFVIWSIDVLMLFSRVADEEHYVEQDRDLQTSSSTTQHESSSRPFQDTLFQLSMKQLTDTVHHLHTIVTHQLQSCVPKPYKRDVTCRSRILPFIGNNLQRTSHLPSPLCSFELLSEEAFKVMACVAICLNSILNGGSSPSGTASFDQTMLNDMDKLNDYGYGILLAS